MLQIIKKCILSASIFIAAKHVKYFKIQDMKRKSHNLTCAYSKVLILPLHKFNAAIRYLPLGKAKG